MGKPWPGAIVEAEAITNKKFTRLLSTTQMDTHELKQKYQHHVLRGLILTAQINCLSPLPLDRRL